MTKRKTHKEFIKEIKDKYGDEYTILGEYINNRTKILVRHNKCGYEWEIKPYHLLNRDRCPKCAGNIKKTTEEFKKEIYELYGNEYEILGEYKGANIKILVRHNCKECNYHEWETKPNDLLRNHKCPVCARQRAILGINTIWDTDRWMCDLGVSEEDAKKYSRGSDKKISVRCPYCDKRKEIKINQIHNNKSISCSCGDGKSYPEKFVINLLEQLDTYFETEYSPNWIDNKRYDFYIKDNVCIIETHGEQHYKQTSRKGKGVRTLEEEQANDKYKRDVALQNGIKHYIELDCKESKLEYIKNSILSSELNDLFDLSKVNWTNCAEFANKNIVKEVCDYWNNRKEDETTVDLGNIFNLNKNTINSYLKRGTKLGWCNYNPKEERKKTSSGNGKASGKRVGIFKEGESLGLFKSCRELTRKSEELFGVKLGNSMISSVCRGEQNTYKGYQFKYIENVA
ncbi:hypothetical protein H8J86_13005 [Clostridium perfringens]|uniref:hypothetical protein n=1 Tax=Clostridium perfringens TaxID=1502 RepID=UPI0018E4C42D|nr:hypothetical protein [Clostridium perfringens]MBI6006854.1 hypothetical protein [Clostridium perfringens]